MIIFIDEVLNWGISYIGINSKPKIVIYEHSNSILGAYDCEINTISINKNCDNQVKTLFHELVHCKQFESGSLKRSDGAYFWKRRRKRGVKLYKIEKMNEYWDAPHERQARHISDVMFNKFRRLKYNYFNSECPINGLLIN